MEVNKYLDENEVFLMYKVIFHVDNKLPLQFQSLVDNLQLYPVSKYVQKEPLKIIRQYLSMNCIRMQVEDIVIKELINLLEKKDQRIFRPANIGTVPGQSIGSKGIYKVDVLDTLKLSLKKYLEDKGKINIEDVLLNYLFPNPNLTVNLDHRFNFKFIEGINYNAFKDALKIYLHRFKNDELASNVNNLVEEELPSYGIQHQHLDQIFQQLVASGENPRNIVIRFQIPPDERFIDKNYIPKRSKLTSYTEKAGYQLMKDYKLLECILIREFENSLEIKEFNKERLLINLVPIKKSAEEPEIPKKSYPSTNVPIKKELDLLTLYENGDLYEGVNLIKNFSTQNNPFNLILQIMLNNNEYTSLNNRNYNNTQDYINEWLSKKSSKFTMTKKRSQFEYRFKEVI